MGEDMKDVEAHLSAWADVLSFLLLGVTILIGGGVDPRRRVWGRSPLRNTLLVTFLSINILYSAGRFVAEGVLVETGPREFLLLSVVYCLRWLWLYVKISKSGSRSGKAFQVARALRELKMIRLGPSSKRPDDGGTKISTRGKCMKRAKNKSEDSAARNRLGEPELVVRKGARVAPKGDAYWRGVEKKAEFKESTATWLVHIVQKELHSDVLDEIGTVEFRKTIETASTDHLYKKFYELVMTVDNQNCDLPVNYGPFLEATGPVVNTDSRQSQRVQANAESDLGNVARRVAADACFYIWHSGETIELRTKNHVELINSCLDDAVRYYLGSDANV